VEPWEEIAVRVPPELAPWLLDFGWSPGKLQALLLPVVELELAEVAWMLDLPCWQAADGSPFRVRPLDVVGGPHQDRVERADLGLPVDVTWRGGRWVVLDGLYRVLKAARAGNATIPARVVPPEALGEIAA
jgi:hypothetical protein